MGNQPSSRPSPQSPSPTPPTPTNHGERTSHATATPTAPTAYHAGSLRPQHNPRRRVSIQTLNIKANAVPPETSLESATTTTHPTSARPSSRGRASTISASGPTGSTGTPTAFSTVATQLRETQDSFLRPLSEDDAMGNEQSRQKGRAHHGRTFTPPDAKQPAEKPSPSPHTRPVDVPAVPAVPAVPREEQKPISIASSFEPSSASQLGYFPPSSQFSRPPRLPLPIEEEVHTPGSPILSPTDFVSPVFPNEIDGGVLPRRISVLSSTTADDDDLGEEFKGPQGQPTVPTLVEWEAPGERVYVTGTFAGWNRKYKLHTNGPSPKQHVLSAMVNIVPGTHHLKFIVDGDMKTSDKLPTAVDYTNILVNYLEVSVDDIPQPDAGVTEETKKMDEIPVQDQPAPENIFPPQVMPPEPEPPAVPVVVPEPPKPKAASAPSPKRYHDVIPRYLLDLDAPEESSRMQRANAVASNLPTPPSLPMFLSKSILNGSTPMKDDSSVLIMPNHTVLNHLATSSIKDNILATSGTTRYKQKFLTTIMYKPKYADSEGH